MKLNRGGALSISSRDPLLCDTVLSGSAIAATQENSDKRRINGIRPLTFVQVSTK